MTPPTRPMTPNDRAAALALIGSRRAIDQPSHRVQVLDNAQAGAAVWIAPSVGNTALLGLVKLSAPAGGTRIDRRFYQLIDACAKQALAEGFTHATFTITDPRLLAQLERDFTIEPVPLGTIDGQPLEWEITVELVDAIAQLAAVL